MSVCRFQRSVSQRRFFYGLALPLVVAMMSGTARAQPLETSSRQLENRLAVWGGHGDSDNIGRTTTPESGAYQSLGLLLGLQRETPRLDAAVSSDVEYRTYSDDTLDNELVGTLDAEALVDLVQDRFAWNFEGTFDQGQQDPFAARGPTNRETVSDLITGPRLDIPFGRTSLQLGANRSTRRYEESTQADSDSDNFQIALARQARPATVFALVASSSDTEYVDDAAPSHRIDQLFVRIERTSRRSTLNAELGTNEISSDIQQSRRDPLLSLSWSRSLGARSRLDINAAQGFTNTGDIGSAGSSLVTTAPFEQETFGVGYSLTGDRTTVRVGITEGEEDYAGGSTIDNDYRSTDLTVEYRVSTRLDIGFRYERYDREYANATVRSASQEDRTTGVWLNRALGRRFSIAFDISRYEATGSERVEEERSEFRFAYSPTGGTSSAMGSIGR